MISQLFVILNKTMTDKNRKVPLIFLGFLAFLDILAWLAVFDLSKQEFLEVNFFAVGQGDATFIETPGGHQILIDGGPNALVLEKLGNTMPFWDRTIDLIILSHPEKDHFAGLIGVLKKYNIEYILWSGVMRETPEYKEWMELIAKEGAGIKIAEAGGKIILGDAEIKILYPFESQEGILLKDSNDSSIVAKLIFGRRSFLFTGDISGKAESDLVQQLSDIDSDILKISHHGSKYSTVDEFIKAVSPETAVIQAGKDNSYGHPAREVLERLQKYGIDILRTDINGDIKIISDGENIQQIQIK